MRPRSTTFEAMTMDEFLQKCQQTLDSKSMRDCLNPSSSRRRIRNAPQVKAVMRKSRKNISVLCDIPEAEEVPSDSEVQEMVIEHDRNLREIARPSKFKVNSLRELAMANKQIINA